jgi:hypothetical protein
MEMVENPLKIPGCKFAKEISESPYSFMRNDLLQGRALSMPWRTAYRCQVSEGRPEVLSAKGFADSGLGSL